ncbi:MAG: CHASE2 domain-containing protein [Halomonadaceae bacterium]|nr:MAG: CHASE2 domain-containing protein [Halomonadaceae bacterium]
MRSRLLFPSQRLARWQLALPLSLLLLALAWSPVTQRLDLWVYDALISQTPLTPTPELLLVAIDEKSLHALGQWPWPRSYHARLIDQLADAGVRSITLDILFTEPARDPQEDQLLASAMANQGNVVLPVHLFSRRDGQSLAEFLPTSTLTRAAAGLGHVHVELDKDGIARGLYRHEGLGQAIWPSLADITAQHANRQTLPDRANSQVAAPFVNLRSNPVRVPFSGPTGTLPRVSYVDVLEGRIPLGQLRDRVIMVGATAPGLGDLLATPVSGRAQPMSGVEFHGNAYSALVQDRLVKTLEPHWVQLLTLALLGLIIWQLPRLLPGHTALLCALLILLPPAIAWLLLKSHSLWLPPTLPAMVGVIAFPLWSGQRLALLNRFLNRQLDALGREPRIQLESQERRTPLQLLEQLNELLQPAEAWLVRDGHMLHGHQPVILKALPAPTHSGQWQHFEDLSRVCFSRQSQWYELGFRWQEGPAQNGLRRFLAELSLNSNDGNRSIRRAREQVSRRIDKVRDATEALAGMRRFVGQGFEQMPDGVIVTDGLGIIRYSNHHIALWFGQPRASLEGMPLVRLLRHSQPEHREGWREPLLGILQGGDPCTLGTAVAGRDLLLHLAPFPLPDPSQFGIVANVSDISRLREQQRQHRDAINFISHDMRSPLVSQLALLDQLRTRSDPIPPEALDQAVRLARRSYQLAEEFVQLSRAEQLTEDRFYDCELLAIAENAADSVDSQAQLRKTRIIVEGDEAIWLKGNAELLERVIINLLTNAIQYGPDNARVEVQVTQEGDKAVISVSDEGPGIAWEEQPFIFERFRRQMDSELHGPRGAGLGLTFVKTVTDRHRGQITLTSVPGQGTTFRLYLPLQPLPTD